VDVETQAARYRQGGAAALSVLTDEAFFGARPDDLARAKAASGLPTLRKDFIVDPWQVCESKGMGADAVLLIVAALPDAAMRECLHVASALGLVVLVEVHNDSELDRAVDAGAELVGVNNRDLRTFAVDLERGLRMRERIPAHCLAVAESGIRTPADVQAVRRAGFDAVLIGEALMESPDPARLIRELLTDDSASSKRAARAYGHSP
jgi:indole-3-glycerol phosphate synthase